MTTSLEDQFVADLDEIAEFLITTMRIQYSTDIDHLSLPLLRWLDFRLRYIDPQPREVLVADVVDRPLPESVRKGLAQFMELAKAGVDLNAFQSKTMVRFHDVSGEDRRKRTDLLWADWGIHHLHITDAPYDPGSEYMPRACSDNQAWLLFFVVFADAFLLVDVRPHDEMGVFSDPDLLRILKRNWPAYMDQFRIPRRGIQQERHIDPGVRAQMRSAGVMTPVVLDGDAYFGPGTGITSASTPIGITVARDNLQTWVRQLAASVAEFAGPFRSDARAKGVESPAFSLKVCPSGLIVHEATLDVGYVLSFGEAPDQRIQQMNQWMCPPWVLRRLTEVRASQNA